MKLQGDPSKGARLCFGHFNHTDIIVSSNGKTLLKIGAIPTISYSDHKYGSVALDHTYSMISKSSEAGFMSVCMMLVAVFICWLPFLILFLYYLTSDSNYIPPKVKRKSRIVPVSEDMFPVINVTLTMCTFIGICQPRLIYKPRNSNKMSITKISQRNI